MAQGRPEDFERMMGGAENLRRVLDDMAKRLMGAQARMAHAAFFGGFATGGFTSAGSTNTTWHMTHEGMAEREINPRSPPPSKPDRSGVRQFEFGDLLELFYTDQFGRRVSVLNATGDVATIAVNRPMEKAHREIAAAISAMQRMDKLR